MSWGLGKITGDPKAVRARVEAFRCSGKVQQDQFDKIKPIILEQIDKANCSGVQVDACGHAGDGVGTYQSESLSFSVQPFPLELEQKKPEVAAS